MKRIFAVHDISGVGKCSLTAALPVISACGVECSPVPTAVLSSHTGEMKGYTFRDLTDDIEPYFRHWLSLGIVPDTIYTGYLGSGKQIEIIMRLISEFSLYSPLIIVDPAMADSGVLYKGFDSSYIDGMKDLCSLSDVLIPNITEAAMLTGSEYKTGYDREYIHALAQALCGYAKKYTVITGVSFSEDESGCYVYDKTADRSGYLPANKYPGTYYGTGDIFASVLSAFLTLGFDVMKAAEYALEFTNKSIKETYENKTDPRFGVAFEKYLPDLMRYAGGKV